MLLFRLHKREDFPSAYFFDFWVPFVIYLGGTDASDIKVLDGPAYDVAGAEYGAFYGQCFESACLYGSCAYHLILSFLGISGQCDGPLAGGEVCGH